MRVHISSVVVFPLLVAGAPIQAGAQSAPAVSVIAAGPCAPEPAPGETTRLPLEKDLAFGFVWKAAGKLPPKLSVSYLVTPPQPPGGPPVRTSERSVTLETDGNEVTGALCHRLSGNEDLMAGNWVLGVRVAGKTVAQRTFRLADGAPATRHAPPAAASASAATLEVSVTAAGPCSPEPAPGETTRLPLEKDLAFGFAWKATGKLPTKLLVTYLVTPPQPPGGPRVRASERSITLDTDGTEATATLCHRLSGNEDLLAGNWVLGVRYAGRTVAQRTFRLDDGTPATRHAGSAAAVLPGAQSAPAVSVIAAGPCTPEPAAVETTRLPLEKDLAFGFAWKATGKLPTKLLVTYLVTPPQPPGGPRVRASERSITLDTDGTEATATLCHRLSGNEHLLAGNWVLGVRYAGRTVAQRTFRLDDGAPATRQAVSSTREAAPSTRHAAAAAASDSPAALEITVTAAGLCARGEPVRREAVRQSTAGYSNFGEIAITEQTSRVPLERGVAFGISWRATGQLPATMPVTYLVTHPRIRRPDGRSMLGFEESASVETSGSEAASTYCYELSEDHELVAGNWVLGVRYNGRTVAQRTFRVASPE